MTDWNRGDLVEIDGLLAVVVGVQGDADVPDEHVAVWFGEPKCTRVSEGGPGAAPPEVWTVPAEYLTRAKSPIVKH